MEIAADYLLDVVERAITEDVEHGDVTTMSTIPEGTQGRGEIIARHSGIVSGLDVAALVFYRLDSNSEFVTNLKEGSHFSSGQSIVEIAGTLQSLLTGERTALNFLMHLSGIATATAKYVQMISHNRCKILDTRKTIPGLRLLEKRAVESGGGVNHRIGLFDMILIKNNHVAVAGSIKKAIEEAVEWKARNDRPDLKIEVEAHNLAEVEQAIHLPVDRIMLDNFNINDATAAVKQIRKSKPELEIEASGNMRLDNIKEYAETGVDFISVGAITHSAPWIDLAMRIGHF